MHPLDVDNRGDLACPRCGAALEGLRCTGCGAVFETVLGVPFLGDFEAADALGLIEIAANAPNRASLAVQPDWVEWFDALCAAYHVAPDREAFIAEHEAAQAFYFQHRYSEWRAVETLLEGQEIAGRDVLDVGAGPGFDAWRLALRGARVTAIDFSPILTEVGQGSLPGMRWFGGFSHALPFRDASFDFVFVNAALHHMRDLPVSIAEALRVLRPGGVLITSGDPFRSDAAGPSLEFDVFDKHEAVLLGINEQIPRASDFLTTLERNRDILDTEIFTQTLHGGRSGHGPDLTEWTRWDLDADAAMLKQRHGNFALRVRLKAPWPHPRHLQTDGILAPATFAGWLDDPADAIAEPRAHRPAQRRRYPLPWPARQVRPVERLARGAVDRDDAHRLSPRAAVPHARRGDDAALRHPLRRAGGLHPSRECARGRARRGRPGLAARRLRRGRHARGGSLRHRVPARGPAGRFRRRLLRGARARRPRQPARTGRDAGGAAAQAGDARRPAGQACRRTAADPALTVQGCGVGAQALACQRDRVRTSAAAIPSQSSSRAPASRAPAASTRAAPDRPAAPSPRPAPAAVMSRATTPSIAVAHLFRQPADGRRHHRHAHAVRQRRDATLARLAIGQHHGVGGGDEVAPSPPRRAIARPRSRPAGSTGRGERLRIAFAGDEQRRLRMARRNSGQASRSRSSPL